MLHVIISLARTLEPAFETNAAGVRGILQATALDAETDLADRLRVAPLLSRRLEGYVFLSPFVFHLSTLPGSSMTRTE